MTNNPSKPSPKIGRRNLTYAALPVNDPAEYEGLSEATKEALAAWIELAVLPWPKEGPGDSYSLKHDFERARGFHVSNGAMKGAMLAAGHAPIDARDLNWRFRVRPAASQLQLRQQRQRIKDWQGYFPLPDDDREGAERLAVLVNRAKGKVA